VFLADQDDIWLKDKMRAQLVALEQYDLVLSDATVVDEERNVLHPSFFRMNGSGPGFIRNWINNSFMGCCMAFNRKILDYVLPFPDNIAMHDSWIGLNAALIGRCCFLQSTPLAVPAAWQQYDGFFQKESLAGQLPDSVQTANDGLYSEEEGIKENDKSCKKYALKFVPDR
jgi:hypothetical protein